VLPRRHSGTSWLQEAERADVIALCQRIHFQQTDLYAAFRAEASSCAAFCHCTPSAYLDLLSTFRGALPTKRTEASNKAQRHAAALAALGAAATAVACRRRALGAARASQEARAAETEVSTRDGASPLFGRCVSLFP
jgi:hypothetical protein